MSTTRKKTEKKAAPKARAKTLKIQAFEKGRPRNYLRAWREFRHFTQEQLAAAVGTTAPVISLLESGDRRLSDKWLRRLAPVLNTQAGYLLDYDPNELPTSILDIWASIPDDLKPQALTILQTFQQKRA